MTRILHILDHSLPLHSGYTFRTRAIMKSQIASGLTVAGVTGVRQNQHGFLGERPQDSSEGLDFFRTMEEVQGPSPVKEWREVAVLADRIEQVVRDWQPDVLHAHSPALNGLAALRASQRTGLPLLYEIRAFWEDAAVGNGTGKEGNPRYWLTRQLENHVVSGADAVAVICEGLKTDLMSRGVMHDKITVSPNGVDLELFGNSPRYDSDLAKQLGIDGGIVLGFIGSFYDYEGLDDLVAALPILQQKQSNIHLLLVGGGPRGDALKEQARQLGVQKQTTFTGRVRHEEVERYYSLMDVMVYPRKSMRLTGLVTPLKPLEAMAQGRLVAASDVGGHKELIEDEKTGYLFPAGNPEKIAKKLSDLIKKQDEWPQVLETERKFVEADRNWSSNILRYNPVYQRLIAGKISSRRPEQAENIVDQLDQDLTRFKKPAMALVGGIAAALVVATLPSVYLEKIIGMTGVAEIIPAAAPPLGNTAKSLLAIFAGLVSTSVIFYFLHRQGGSDMGLAIRKLANWEEEKAEWEERKSKPKKGKFSLKKLLQKPKKKKDEVKDLSDLPNLREKDVHPDAPARQPIFAEKDLGSPLETKIKPFDQQVAEPEAVESVEAEETPDVTPAPFVMDKSLQPPEPQHMQQEVPLDLSGQVSVPPDADDPEANPTPAVEAAPVIETTADVDPAPVVEAAPQAPRAPFAAPEAVSVAQPIEQLREASHRYRVLISSGEIV